MQVVEAWNPSPSGDSAPITHPRWVCGPCWRVGIGTFCELVASGLTQGGRSEYLLHRMSATQDQRDGDSWATVRTPNQCSHGEPRVHRAGHRGARRHGCDACSRRHFRSALGQRPSGVSLSAQAPTRLDEKAGKAVAGAVWHARTPSRTTVLRRQLPTDPKHRNVRVGHAAVMQLHQDPPTYVAI